MFSLLFFHSKGLSPLVFSIKLFSIHSATLPPSVHKGNNHLSPPFASHQSQREGSNGEFVYACSLLFYHSQDFSPLAFSIKLLSIHRASLPPSFIPQKEQLLVVTICHSPFTKRTAMMCLIAFFISFLSFPRFFTPSFSIKLQSVHSATLLPSLRQQWNNRLPPQSLATRKKKPGAVSLLVFLFYLSPFPRFLAPSFFN